MALYICVIARKAFLEKFLKDFSGDQIVAWGLFGIDFTFDDFLNQVTDGHVDKMEKRDPANRSVSTTH